MKKERDESWKTTFEIRERENPDKGATVYPKWLPFVYDVVNIHTGEIVSSYRERRYAIKQARRKYKKLVKLMERSFMSVTEVVG